MSTSRGSSASWASVRERGARERYGDGYAEGCKTPRRNDDVDEAVREFASLGQWGWAAAGYFQYEVASRLAPRGDYRAAGKGGDRKGHGAGDLFSTIDESRVFVPVIPVFWEDGGDAEAGTGPTLSGVDVDVLLGEQRRTIDAALASLDGAFPPPGSAGVASSAEARLILLSRHLASVSEAFGRAIERVEEMLRSQLTAAIGREIDAATSTISSRRTIPSSSGPITSRSPSSTRSAGPVGIPTAPCRSRRAGRKAAIRSSPSIGGWTGRAWACP